MKFRHRLAASAALVLAPAAVSAQTVPPNTPSAPDEAAAQTPRQPSGAAQAAPSTSAQSDTQDIVVTARQREESLKDVPIAVTAVTGDFLKQQQINTVRDVAAFAPGLNINSDGVGRAFVSIRGVGTTLIDTVQPGVGIFVDGIYLPDTSYLNLPIVDISRIEVLRGPQGTLFGNNTLGGAINVITRQPSNDWHGRIDLSAAGPDNFYTAGGSISGPIIRDVIQFRIGGAIHVQDNFQKNTITGGNRNPLDQRSINGTLRILPATWAVLTFNASYDHVFGGDVPYANLASPQDYTRNLPTNLNNYATISYQNYNGKGEFNVAPLKTKITIIGAYDYSHLHQPLSDGDYGPIDFVHFTSDRVLKTTTAEVRFDTQWSDAFSTLIGGFYSDYSIDYNPVDYLNLGPPIGFFKVATNSLGKTRTRAVFGTGFLKITPTLELSAGLRFDHQVVSNTQATTAATYRANELQPRFTLTQHWTPDFMTYASVARGIRGGGQNDPGAPNLLYRGDSVWTYELGTKFAALDRKLSGSADVFYNSYNNFIGANALAPSTIPNAGFVAVNLNQGHVESYGAELEVSYNPTRALHIYGNATLLHERVTNSREFEQTTGYAYPGNRVPFVPALDFTVGGNYRAALGRVDSLVLDANVVYKGRREGDTLSAASIPFLSHYALVNASLGWDHNNFEIAAFTTNLFNSKYLETYLDASLLTRAGFGPPIAANLGILGQDRRFGVRASFKF